MLAASDDDHDVGFRPADWCCHDVGFRPAAWCVHDIGFRPAAWCVGCLMMVMM